MNKLFVTICLLFLISSINSCIDKNKDFQDSNFDRKSMLVNYSNNIIKKNMTDLSLEVNLLDTLINKFTQNPNNTTLTKAQDQFKICYISFQHCNIFNFGPGIDIINGEFSLAIGTFPTSTIKIESYITASDTDIKRHSYDSKGFPAIDYLLFSDANADVVSKFSDQKRVIFLKKLSENLLQAVNNFNTQWATYESVFLTQTSTDIGSSTSVIYNELLKSYENIKNYKLGLPLGKRVGQRTSEPSKLEGLYCGISTLLIKENLLAIDHFWAGKSKSGIDGIGFDDYILSTENGQSLVNNTKEQMATINQKINMLPSKTLKELITINDTVIANQVYAEISKHTRFYKSEMSSKLGLSITYSSNDND